MKSMGGSKKVFFKAIEAKLNAVIKDVVGFRVAISQISGDLGDRILELRRECTALTTGMGALLDLLTDLTNMPTAVIKERFARLVNERSIVKEDGKVAGNVFIGKKQGSSEAIPA